MNINDENFEEEFYNYLVENNIKFFSYQDYLEFKNKDLSKLMLIEKYKKGNDLMKCLDKVVDEIYSNKEEYKGEGKKVIFLALDKILREKVGYEKTEQLIKKLKGDDREMLQILETIREENEDIRNEGRIEEKKEIIREMLKRNMPVDLISEITHFSKQKIKQMIKL